MRLRLPAATATATLTAVALGLALAGGHGAENAAQAAGLTKPRPPHHARSRRNVKPKAAVRPRRTAHVHAPAPAPVPVPAPTSASAPDDPAWPQEWSLARVRAAQAWQLGPSSHSVVVAVIDSGVDPAQPDLQGALVPGFNVLDGSANTTDAYGHGTMVAGVIGARADNGIGVAGVCNACVIMPVKVLDASGGGSAAGVAAGFRWAADHGASIANISIVLSGDDPDVRAAVAYAEERGVLVVAAAGNGGTTAATFPASYPGVLSVAATDETDRPYPWTTFGDWVAVAAPGCAQSTEAGGSYGEFCGTSAAAPLVAGLAGLAMATGIPTAAAVGRALQRTASPLPGVVASGRVDGLSLLQQVAG